MEFLDIFLRQVNDLKAFTAYDLLKEPLRSAVFYHGNHLRQLRFRHTGFRFMEISRPHNVRHSPFAMDPEFPEGSCLFSPDELRDLSAELPLVKRLGIDLCFKNKVVSPPRKLVITRIRELTYQALQLS